MLRPARSLSGQIVSICVGCVVVFFVIGCPCTDEVQPEIKSLHVQIVQIETVVIVFCVFSVEHPACIMHRAYSFPAINIFSHSSSVHASGPSAILFSRFHRPSAICSLIYIYHRRFTKLSSLQKFFWELLVHVPREFPKKRNRSRMVIRIRFPFKYAKTGALSLPFPDHNAASKTQTTDC